MATELEVMKGKVNTIGAMLESRKQMIAQVLPRHIKADRLIKVMLMAMNRQPALLNCTPASLFQSLMMAGQLGLEPDGVLGSAYLVPYGTQCTLIPGYRGLIDLARRSGQIKSIEAHLIRKNDKFECAFGLEPTLTHSPVFPGDEEYLKNDNIIGAYAVAKLVDGGEQFEVMSRAEIDAIRKRSKASGSGPWVTDFGEMARKTVVRRLFKYLPVSIEMASALELDNRADTGDNLLDLIDLPAEVIPKDDEPKRSATEKLAEKTRGKAKEEPPKAQEGGEKSEPKGSTGDKASKAQVDRIKELSANLGHSLDAICQDYRVATVEDLSPADAVSLITWLKNQDNPTPGA